MGRTLVDNSGRLLVDAEGRAQDEDCPTCGCGDPGNDCCATGSFGAASPTCGIPTIETCTYGSEYTIALSASASRTTYSAGGSGGPVTLVRTVDWEYVGRWRVERAGPGQPCQTIELELVNVVDNILRRDGDIIGEFHGPASVTVGSLLGGLLGRSSALLVRMSGVLRGSGANPNPQLPGVYVGWASFLGVSPFGPGECSGSASDASHVISWNGGDSCPLVTASWSGRNDSQSSADYIEEAGSVTLERTTIVPCSGGVDEPDVAGDCGCGCGGDCVG